MSNASDTNDDVIQKVYFMNNFEELSKHYNSEIIETDQKINNIRHGVSESITSISCIEECTTVNSTLTSEYSKVHDSNTNVYVSDLTTKAPTQENSVISPLNENGVNKVINIVENQRELTNEAKVNCSEELVPQESIASSSSCDLKLAKPTRCDARYEKRKRKSKSNSTKKYELHSKVTPKAPVDRSINPITIVTPPTPPPITGQCKRMFDYDGNKDSAKEYRHQSKIHYGIDKRENKYDSNICKSDLSSDSDEENRV